MEDKSLNENSVTTLFEKTHHFGVVGLVNSLHRQGFQGNIYAGYRGPLPDWAQKSEFNPSLNWDQGRTLKIQNNILLHFIPLSTNYNFSNYKAHFALELIKGPCKETKRLYYFDPDITVDYPWSFYEKWVESGIAVCEDVLSPLSEFHPTRTGWRKYYKDFRIDLKFKNPIFTNAGFYGLNQKDFGFLELLKKMMEYMAPVIGGLEHSNVSGGLSKLASAELENYAPFKYCDQDAFNAALEAWNGNISYLGKEGMNFEIGVIKMSHAIGKVKPWNKSFALYFINGRPPTRADREYWKNMKFPLKAYSKEYVNLKNLAIKISRFLGRFYSRNEG